MLKIGFCLLSSLPASQTILNREFNLTFLESAPEVALERLDFLEEMKMEAAVEAELDADPQHRNISRDDPGYSTLFQKRHAVMRFSTAGFFHGPSPHCGRTLFICTKNITFSRIV
jgi:hypothetical protein